MEIGISTILFTQKNPIKTIEIAERLDLKHIEIIHDMPHYPPGTGLEELKQPLESSGLKPRVHGRFWDLNPISFHHDLREKANEEVKKSIKNCSEIGGEIVTIHPGQCWFRDKKEHYEKKICKKKQ